MRFILDKNLYPGNVKIVKSTPPLQVKGVAIKNMATVKDHKNIT